MKKLTDRTFGRLTVHADGGYSWGGKRIPPRCADVLDSCFLLACNTSFSSGCAINFLLGSKIMKRSGTFSLPHDDLVEAAEYVRDNWVWVNE